MAAAVIIVGIVVQQLTWQVTLRNLKEVTANILTAIFPGGPGLAGTRMSPPHSGFCWSDGGGGNNWSYKRVKLHSNRHHQ